MHSVFPLIIMKIILIVFTVFSVCDEENFQLKDEKVSKVGCLAQKTPDFPTVNFV